MPAPEGADVACRHRAQGDWSCWRQKGLTWPAGAEHRGLVRRRHQKGLTWPADTEHRGTGHAGTRRG